jgi:hypothetical protein
MRCAVPFSIDADRRFNSATHASVASSCSSGSTLEVLPRELLDRGRQRVGDLAAGDQERAEPQRGVDLGEAGAEPVSA